VRIHFKGVVAKFTTSNSKFLQASVHDNYTNGYVLKELFEK